LHLTQRARVPATGSAIFAALGPAALDWRETRMVQNQDLSKTRMVQNQDGTKPGFEQNQDLSKTKALGTFSIASASFCSRLTSAGASVILVKSLVVATPLNC
jgi:hypothetical protein